MAKCSEIWHGFGEEESFKTGGGAPIWMIRNVEGGGTTMAGGGGSEAEEDPVLMSESAAWPLD